MARSAPKAPPAAAAPADEESVRVYRDVQASVVSLRNAEGSGTGIVLDALGLILTNAHVVVSPLPYECTADVTEAGKPRRVTFKKVQVVGFHPRLDLALVRVDPHEQSAILKPVMIRPDKGQPGQRVYVIGNPAGGGGMVLTKTISGGMLSAVDREVDGDNYYQTDAAINPGNSGGPLCDRSGLGMGLVTFKFTDVENIGFAIPLAGLDTKAFVPLLRRRANPDRAAELVKLADGFRAKANDAQRQRGAENDDVKRL